MNSIKIENKTPYQRNLEQSTNALRFPGKRANTYPNYPHREQPIHNKIPSVLFQVKNNSGPMATTECIFHRPELQPKPNPRAPKGQKIQIASWNIFYGGRHQKIPVLRQLRGPAKI
jgi:hypothetical protein